MRQHPGAPRLARALGLGLALVSLSFPTAASEYWFDPDDHLREFSGTVKFVDLKAAFLSAEDGRHEMEGFYATARSQIVRGKDPIGLQNIREGDRVSITYHEELWGNDIERLEVVLKE